MIRIALFCRRCSLVWQKEGALKWEDQKGNGDGQEHDIGVLM